MSPCAGVCCKNAHEKTMTIIVASEASRNQFIIDRRYVKCKHLKQFSSISYFLGVWSLWNKKIAKMPAATKFSKTWEIIPDFKNWLSQGPHDKKARCSWCNSVFSISHGGKNDVIKHMNTRNHQELKKLKLTTKPAIQCQEGQEGQALQIIGAYCQWMFKCYSRYRHGKWRRFKWRWS